jgi:hypothetical protein
VAEPAPVGASGVAFEGDVLLATKLQFLPVHNCNDHLVVTPRQRQKHVSHVLDIMHRPIAHPEGTLVPGRHRRFHPPFPLSGDARRKASS